MTIIDYICPNCHKLVFPEVKCAKCKVHLEVKDAIQNIKQDHSVEFLCLDCHRKNQTVDDWPETFARYKQTDDMLLDPDATWEALEDVRHERALQDAKWGDQSRITDLQWLSIETEELGEVARAINELDLDNLKKEIIQVGAVAVRWLEALKRREGKGSE